MASDLDQVWEIQTHGVDDPQDGAMELVKLGGRMLEAEDTGSGGVGPVVVVAEYPSVETCPFDQDPDPSRVRLGSGGP